jgi:hypothetical protein
MLNFDIELSQDHFSPRRISEAYIPNIHFHFIFTL